MLAVVDGRRPRHGGLLSEPERFRPLLVALLHALLVDDVVERVVVHVTIVVPNYVAKLLDFATPSRNSIGRSPTETVPTARSTRCAFTDGPVTL